MPSWWVRTSIATKRERGACLPVRVFRCRVLDAFSCEVCDDPPPLLWLLARGRSMTEEGLEVVRDFLRDVHVPRGFHDFRGRWGQKWRLIPQKGGRRGLFNEVQLGEENISERHVRPRRSLKTRQEVVSVSTGFSRRQAKLKCLVGSRDETRGGGGIVS